MSANPVYTIEVYNGQPTRRVLRDGAHLATAESVEDAYAFRKELNALSSQQAQEDGLTFCAVLMRPGITQMLPEKVFLDVRKAAMETPRREGVTIALVPLDRKRAPSGITVMGAESGP